MKTSKREIGTLWRASKVFEFIRQRGDEPPEYIDECTLDAFRRYHPSSIVFGLDRAFDHLQRGSFDQANWETLWRFADLEMRAFDENAETDEPVRPDVVAKMFKGTF
jgi:hypothetical protein